KIQEIAGGEYKFHKDMGLYFQPKSAKVKLGLGEASSAVRSLMIIWFWLCHVANENSFIMIDEPELNLHPENQRKFARFIVSLVNAGVKVFMTTHSDYVIRELNTLVLMNSNCEHIEKVQKKYGYDIDEKISFKNINVYSTNIVAKKR
ncbi:AAA family ATPase, partial [Acinetobacter johnsonii]|uniref:AAA family ATPase n=1 Tax=Acinetobacter johnsonii TaxID=40214 RepID=UPI00244CC1AD